METESVFMNMGIVLACEKNVDVLYNTEFEMYFILIYSICGFT